MLRSLSATWIRRVIAVCLSGAFFAGSAQSATILIDGPMGGGFQVQAYAASGQSFVALGQSLTQIGFHVADWNAFFNDPTFTMELRAGSGTGGALLGSATVTPGRGFYGFATTTDLNGIALIEGNQYTALILNDTPEWGYDITSTDVYAGGNAFVSDGTMPYDLLFMASFVDSSSVPEPASLALFGLGLFAVAASRRRKQ